MAKEAFGRGTVRRSYERTHVRFFGEPREPMTIRLDFLPAASSQIVADYMTDHGIRAGIKILQRAVNTPENGVLDTATRDAIRQYLSLFEDDVLPSRLETLIALEEARNAHSR